MSLLVKVVAPTDLTLCGSDPRQVQVTAPPTAIVSTGAGSPVAIAAARDEEDRCGKERGALHGWPPLAVSGSTSYFTLLTFRRGVARLVRRQAADARQVALDHVSTHESSSPMCC